jgi:hypothetical protein
MRYKTLFRLLMKALGVWIFIIGATRLADEVFVWIWSSLSAPAGMHTSYGFGSIGGIVELIAGLYLFFAGKWVVDLAIPSNRPYCHECGYDLSGATGNVCNECGTPFRGEVAVK